MPARDVYHNAVKAALIADGWTITAEDYTIPVGLQRVYIDLQAERELITAEQGNQKIAVEVKSFIGASTVKDLRDAIGQYIMYRSVLSRLDPGRVPYLAIDSETAQMIVDIAADKDCSVEKLTHYGAILERLVADEAEQVSTSTDVEVCVICDPVRHQYQLLYLGWQGIKPVFSPLIHLRLHNGKVWIEQDGTEEGIATRLLAAGIPREEIVLAFYSPQKRQYTEFAVA